MTEKKNTLAQAMMWNTVGNIVYCICQWIVTIVTVRLDSYSGAGYLSLAMSTSSTFSTIALFGMRNFQVSDVKNEFKDSEYLSSRLLTSTIAMVACALFAINSTSVYQMWCIDAFMLIRLAEASVDVVHGINQKYDRYDLIGKSFLIRGVVTVVFFVAGLLMSHEILVAILCCAIANLLVVTFYDIRHTSKLEKLSFCFKDSHVGGLLKKCIPLVATSFLLTLIPLFPRTSMQWMIGNDELGVYSSIASPTLIVQVFAQYVFSPLVPKISVLYNEKRYDAFLNIFHKILLFFVGFIIVVCIGGTLFGRLGLRILYGADILEHYALFMPLVFCTLFTAFIWIMMSIVTAIRETVYLMVSIGIGAGLCYLLNGTFLTAFGANGASFVQLLSFGIISILLIVRVEIVIRKKK